MKIIKKNSNGIQKLEDFLQFETEAVKECFFNFKRLWDLDLDEAQLFNEAVKFLKEHPTFDEIYQQFLIATPESGFLVSKKHHSCLI